MDVAVDDFIVGGRSVEVGPEDLDLFRDIDDRLERFGVAAVLDPCLLGRWVTNKAQERFLHEHWGGDFREGCGYVFIEGRCGGIYAYAFAGDKPTPALLNEARMNNEGWMMRPADVMVDLLEEWPAPDEDDS